MPAADGPALRDGPRGAYSINGHIVRDLYRDGAIINENCAIAMNPISRTLCRKSLCELRASAEYGRFAGGVATAITSLRHHISGSYARPFANDSCIVTPFESTQLIANPRAAKLRRPSRLRGDVGGQVIRDASVFFNLASRRRRPERPQRHNPTCHQRREAVRREAHIYSPAGARCAGVLSAARTGAQEQLRLQRHGHREPHRPGAAAGSVFRALHRRRAAELLSRGSVFGATSDVHQGRRDDKGLDRWHDDPRHLQEFPLLEPHVLFRVYLSWRRARNTSNFV